MSRENCRLPRGARPTFRQVASLLPAAEIYRTATYDRIASLYVGGQLVLGPDVLGPDVLGPDVLGPAVLGPAVLGDRWS